MTVAATILLLLSLLLVYSLLGSHAQTPENISLGSGLTTTTDSTWLSPSGDFAFGFYPLDSGLFLLGIWFNKIPEETLVWSANRDNPAPEGSTINLTASGYLLLTYPNGSLDHIYEDAAASSASMLDNGNFVLWSSVSRVLCRASNINRHPLTGTNDSCRRHQAFLQHEWNRGLLKGKFPAGGAVRRWKYGAVCIPILR
ncbi:G-type lectin S-receptor-like serine/threonine-protein kinase LECRK4 [Vitis vinifera]|uniref:G-type lectin S-receptor-like serine/threonine-protein kinase LECRK4 n=1 Tax=Vitis vinifera TaxID=29760 RepID=A0A438KL11_VITVI|nr:G-type lectin S-receptor-like serine/threonine-protein kinase LECRK4 [Vitis vinifera]